MANIKLPRSTITYFVDSMDQDTLEFVDKTLKELPLYPRFGGAIPLLPKVGTKEEFMNFLNKRIEENKDRFDWEIFRRYGVNSVEEIQRKAAEAYDNPESIVTSATSYLGRSFERLYGDNIVFVLIDHFGISPEFLSERDQIQYHFVGRGFIGYGNYHEIKDTPHFYCEMQPYHLRKYSREIQRRFLHQLAKHEIIGHCNFKLDDDFSEEGKRQNCIMVPRLSEDDMVRYLTGLKEEPNAVQLCDVCQAKVKPL